MKFGERKKMEQAKIEPIDYSKPELPVTESEDLTSTGFSMIKHPEGGFAIVTLKFNPVTMQAKVEEVRRTGPSRMDSEDAFKMAVGNYFADQEMNS
jgi:hypothetical protein